MHVCKPTFQQVEHLWEFLCRQTISLVGDAEVNAVPPLLVRKEGKGRGIAEESKALFARLRFVFQEIFYDPCVYAPLPTSNMGGNYTQMQ